MLLCLWYTPCTKPAQLLEDRNTIARGKHECSLAGFYMEAGEANKAKQYYLRAVDAKKASMGPVHPSVIDSLLPLARLLKRRGHPEEALPLLELHLKFLQHADQGTSRGLRSCFCRLFLVTSPSLL